mmetsp:Transcript_10656/g.25335  ORF Transcript_10656/g.25335 Transcript_10656/m.25335 type:complete len:219 (-) Transcript_10656:247-903(-)
MRNVSCATTLQSHNACYLAANLREELHDIFVPDILVRGDHCHFLCAELTKRGLASFRPGGQTQSAATCELSLKFLVTLPAAEEGLQRHTHNQILRLSGHDTINSHQDLPAELGQKLQHIFIRGQLWSIDQNACCMEPNTSQIFVGLDHSPEVILHCCVGAGDDQTKLHPMLQCIRQSLVFRLPANYLRVRCIVRRIHVRYLYLLPIQGPHNRPSVVRA